MANSDRSIVRDIIKFNSHTQSRDKVYRTIQYVSRFTIWYLSKSHIPSDVLVQLKKLEAALTTSRKLFRLASSVEFIQKALDALDQTDDFVKILTSIGMLAKGFWLFLDHGLWLGKIDLIKFNMSRLSYLSYLCWLVGNVSLTLRDLRKIQLLKHRAIQMRKDNEYNKEAKLLLKKEVGETQAELYKNALDIFIPLSGLGYANPGIAAFAGIISSLIGLNQEWVKHTH